MVVVTAADVRHACFSFSKYILRLLGMELYLLFSSWTPNFQTGDTRTIALCLSPPLSPAVQCLPRDYFFSTTSFLAALSILCIRSIFQEPTRHSPSSTTPHVLYVQFYYCLHASLLRLAVFMVNRITASSHQNVSSQAKKWKERNIFYSSSD